ncbi:MAG: hypothetical protein AAGF54_11925 [Pseudomonadota bacterium]
MSRIETRTPSSPHLVEASPQTSAAKVGPDSVTGGNWRINQRSIKDLKTRAKREKKFSSIKDISEADLQPLMGAKREQLIGDLSRILVAIQNFEEQAGEDDTSVLCKMMLKEQVRRMLLVKGGQTEADNLRGTA